ncbi:hypothetical protein ACE1MS_12200 [Lysinibacillus sp. fkY74-1]|uniref:hypothetical protein n=1 Tax=Lysinibacillus sphaericus TaxID=1421 RepID=UPI0018CF8B16|nr:hypothetical protein [Lysinibacillus sphaericus]MBG9692983.1 hypothetical protein [Lysinibacillus sphaericus]MEB7453200.1 hypothetical protein [Lysinibacillus sphaericus]QTB25149.1 hypothetical protein J2D51_12285 [Lysinibacillus sphaericus]
MFIQKLFTLWFLISIIVSVVFFFFSHTPIQNAEKSNASLSQPSNDELLGYMQHYQFLISDIVIALQKESYSFQLDYAVLPNGKMELLVSIPETINQLSKQKIEETILDCIQKNDLNPISFQITIKNLYDPVATDSTRLSYNDVMAHLFETMTAQHVGVFSIDHTMTSEHVHIIINLTEEKDDVIQKEVRQVAEDVIKQHQFDIQQFYIEIQNKMFAYHK